jgi:RimJ/RimL family protein N-acetyltransferase
MIEVFQLMRTERLRLRTLAPRDTARIAALAGDWDVARMTARIPYPYSVELADEWIGGLAEGEFVRGIERGGALIGVCGYMPDDSGSAEIGYWIGKPWWGQGFATEAARALIAHCFAVAGFERVTCGHFVDNPASGKVIAKLGFRFIGIDQLWCEARQSEVETLRYERRRGATSV